MTTGFTAVYLFLYSIHFFATKLEITGAASTFLFFGYTAMIVFIFFLVTGKSMLRCCFVTHGLRELASVV